MEQLAIDVRRQLVNNIVKNMSPQQLRGFDANTLQMVENLTDYILKGKEFLQPLKRCAEAEVKAKAVSNSDEMPKCENKSGVKHEQNPMMDLLDVLSESVGVVLVDQDGKKLDLSQLSKFFGKN